MPPVGAVAVVAEDRGHDPDRLDRVLRRHEPERLRQPGGGVGLVVGHAQTAAHQQVEPGDRAAARDRHEAHVLRPDVHAVVGRQRDAGLELPREVDVAVERLLLLGGHLLLAVEPDLVVGLRRGPKPLGDAARGGAHRQVRLVVHRRGAAHHVAVDVAAGSEGGHQAVVDLGDGRLQPALQHPVELEALPGGDAEGAVGPAVGDFLEREVLVRVERARRQRHAHHERVRLLSALVPALACVTVILLIGAVELEQGDVVAFEVAAAAQELLRDGAAEMTSFALGGFDFGLLGHASS